MSDGTINNPRGEIDAIDRELLRLLNKRAEIALRVGAAKAAGETPLCDPNREKEVLERLRQDNDGPFDERSIDNIFQRIIDESLQLQQKTFHRPTEHSDQARSEIKRFTGRSRVAFLGDRGTFSEDAALGILGDECQTVSFPTFEDLFTAIEIGKADLILAPLENSLIGSVHRCVDLLLDSSLTIIADVILPVSHYLVACPEATMDTIKTVESHPAALAQCRRFFDAYPHLESVPADDTAGSVRRAIESGDVTRAGIGGKRTAEIYGGKILREHLEDNSENYTRFALLSSSPQEDTSGSKISLVLRLKNQPGALHSALRPFVRRGIDLLKIESLPIRSMPGQFNFYLDVQTPAIEGDLIGALDEIRDQAEEVRDLGRYSTTKLAKED
ncbi:MAG: prephenate dehydratase domain-containing protein [Acidobacteriota bacterium]